MARQRRPDLFRPPGADYQIEVLGARGAPLSDFYHAIIRLPWWVTIASFSAVFLLANAVFAALYLAVGGVANATPGSFFDALTFSVQTMGTIGYGAMYPSSVAANVLVIAESITGLILTALGTGVVFAKFSRSNARLIFMRRVGIAPMDGVPTLRFRVGNERGNNIVDAQIRVVLIRTERLAEGETFYRTLDLPLLRNRSISLSRSWSVGHRIDELSPLFGLTPETFAVQDSELQVLVTGLDDATHQTVHGRHHYFARDVIWGARPVDIVKERADGHITLDLNRFHDLQGTPETPGFPYSAEIEGGDQSQRSQNRRLTVP